jgi:mediator of RNA polymerase II transcription subunit 31
MSTSMTHQTHLTGAYILVLHSHYRMESSPATNSVSILPASDSDPKSQNRARFELELEFVQSLANPFYLRSLAQQGILDQPHFINYLEYLRYWEDKEYARFLQCVVFLAGFVC